MEKEALDFEISERVKERENDKWMIKSRANCCLFKKLFLSAYGEW